MSLRICQLVDRYRESTGKGVTVAIIDSGVESSHPDIGNRCTSGVVIEERFGNISKKEFDGIDVAGHGTACAGLVLRMAPEARIVSCRILNRSIEATSHALLEALSWVQSRMDDHTILITHTAFYGWALQTFDLNRVIHYGWGNPIEAAAAARMTGYERVYVIWWVRGLGWNPPMPHAFEMVYRRNRIAMYEYHPH